MSDAESDRIRSRSVTSYAARRAFRDAIQFPPDTPGVAGAIDLHCHAHGGQQDAVALARHASRAGMGGLLYKTLDFERKPMDRLAEIRAALDRWADAEKVAPIGCWAGLVTDRWMGGFDPGVVRAHLEAGVSAVWMPTASHANSVSQVGGWRTMWQPRGPRELVGPMPMAHAIAEGAMYALPGGRLDPDVREIVGLCVEHDAALFFGHLTWDEQDALADEIQRRGLRKAVIDHPFSPFVDLPVERMKRFTDAGIFLNFTYDELSPLLGVDPVDMAAAIRAVGPAHCTLSSDAGEPLFPNSVECMRLVRAYMRAFGCTTGEVERMSVANPRHLLGLA